jgi:23S rRNA (cytosine1962-C5)-methyltransferase
MHGHPWVFSGAIGTKEAGVFDGAVVAVAGADGTVLGTGGYSASSTIAVRMMSAGDVVIDAEWYAGMFSAAAARRTLSGAPTGADEGCRIVFGEADGLPGVVLDRYADTYVLQLSTATTDAHRDIIVEAIVRAFGAERIIERSDLPSRHEERLKDRVGVLKGDDVGGVQFREEGMVFEARPLDGQKTGFYLDQRDLRSAVRRLAKGRTMLNLFSYTGATGVAAMAGGAASVLNVDASADALEGCGRSAELNGIDQDRFHTDESDVFQWLTKQDDKTHYGLVAVDPPALIKSKKDAEAGRKAYHFLNRAALRLVEDGGIFMTSSCSRHMSEEDLETTLRRAATQAGVRLHVLARPGQPSDHPRSLYFPEASYLKSFVCLVERQ